MVVNNIKDEKESQLDIGQPVSEVHLHLFSQTMEHSTGMLHKCVCMHCNNNKPLAVATFFIDRVSGYSTALWRDWETEERKKKKGKERKREGNSRVNDSRKRKKVVQRKKKGGRKNCFNLPIPRQALLCTRSRRLYILCSWHRAGLDWLPDQPTFLRLLPWLIYSIVGSTMESEWNNIKLLWWEKAQHIHKHLR